MITLCPTSAIIIMQPPKDTAEPINLPANGCVEGGQGPPLPGDGARRETGAMSAGRRVVMASSAARKISRPENKKTQFVTALSTSALPGGEGGGCCIHFERGSEIPRSETAYALNMRLRSGRRTPLVVERCASQSGGGRRSKAIFGGCTRRPSPGVRRSCAALMAVQDAHGAASGAAQLAGRDKVETLAHVMQMLLDKRPV